MKTTIPSPLPFLTRLPDLRNPKRITHQSHTFWQLTMTALLAGCKNILEMTQWIHDQRQTLIEHLEIRTVSGELALPSQASLYRFLWRIELQLDTLEARLLDWVRAVLEDVEFKQALIGINLDGKYLLGSKRIRFCHAGRIYFCTWRDADASHCAWHGNASRQNAPAYVENTIRHRSLGGDDGRWRDRAKPGSQDCASGRALSDADQTQSA
jgi:hypothetical protein